MKRILHSILPALALSAAPVAAQQAPVPAAAPPAAAAPASAPPTKPADPALWVVKDRDTTIYLFGTIHILPPGYAWFDQAVKAAFDRSDTLVIETVLPDTAGMRALLGKMGMNPTGPTLTEKLPAADRPLYADALKRLGLPANAFDRLDPWLAATELSLLPVETGGFDAANAPETVLTDAAKAAGKPVMGLETPAQQLGYLDGLSQPTQIAFLDETLKDVPKAKAELTQMVGDWAKGDPQALASLLNDDLETTPELRRTLLLDRNTRWAAWVKQRLATPGTVFVAVGAGHLAGKGSVQQQLAKLGVKATRIRY